MGGDWLGNETAMCCRPEVQTRSLILFRMNFLVIGTDHRFQERDPGLEGLVRALAEANFEEPLGAIGEEYSLKIAESTAAARLARDLGITWFNFDMTIQERRAAGIFEEQVERPGMFQGKVTHRVPSDDIREEEWVKRLTKFGRGTTIVICGYLHFESLVEKLRAQGHTVDQRVYLETVPEIRTPEGSQFHSSGR